MPARFDRRRQAALVAAGGDPQQVLTEILDAMSERLRATPGFTEPSAAENRAEGRKIETWLRRRGYHLTAGR